MIGKFFVKVNQTWKILSHNFNIPASAVGDGAFLGIPLPNHAEIFFSNFDFCFYGC